ncbi:MAG: metallopeptidase family protein [Actinobacteria bacterium]|nr:metallopeptidase family protein [Actinomycetota bacterium]
MKLTQASARRGTLRAAVLAALATAVLDPFSWGRLEGVATALAAVVAIVLVAAWGVIALGANEMPEEEFRQLAARSEELAAMPSAERESSEFEDHVRAAIDGLPEDLREVLAEVPIVISNRGHEFRAYGHYIGDTVARDHFHDQIVIYQDTLERDFGHDPGLLRDQVARTVRHEVAHHLGWDEAGVRGLGL